MVSRRPLRLPNPIRSLHPPLAHHSHHNPPRRRGPHVQARLHQRLHAHRLRLLRHRIWPFHHIPTQHKKCQSVWLRDLVCPRRQFVSLDTAYGGSEGATGGGYPDWFEFGYVYADDWRVGTLPPKILFQTLPSTDKNSSIFVSVAQAVFTSHLSSGLQRLDIPGVDANVVSNGGVRTLTKGLTGDEKAMVLRVFNDALTQSWQLPVVLSCISVLGALAIEHGKVKKI